MELKKSNILKNSIFLFFRTIFLLIIGLYTIRELLSVLGVHEFGLFNVVYGVATLFTFINGALMVGTQRYLSYDLGENNIKKLSNTFLMSCIIHIIMAIFVAFCLFFLKDFFIRDMLNIDGFLNQTNIIYYFAILSVFISIIQIPFVALITAYEKMQAFAYLALFEGTMKLLAVYLLLFFNFHKVVIYSIFITIISFFTLMLYFLYSYRNLREVFSISSIKIMYIKENIKKMSSFMGWSLIGNLAVVGQNQGTAILLNMFFGILMNSAFAITMTVIGCMNTLLASVSNAIKPQIFKTYAERNFNEFFILLTNGTKYYVYLMVALVFPIYFCVDEILIFWLKDVPKYTEIFCRLMLVVVIIEAFSSMLLVGIQATGNIKINQIVLGCLLLLNLPVSYFFLKIGHSPEIVFYVSIVISTIVFFVRLIIVNIILKYDIKLFLIKVLGPTLIFMIILFPVLYFIDNFISNFFYGNWGLIINLFFMEVIVLLVFYLFFLDNEIKNKLKINFKGNKNV